MRKTIDNTTRATEPTAGHFYAPGSLDTLERAAARLGSEPEQLRVHCERVAERCGDVAVAHLAEGVVAFEADGCWRFRFPVCADSPSPDGERQ
jgi:hypothetical protein